MLSSRWAVVAMVAVIALLVMSTSAVGQNFQAPEEQDATVIANAAAAASREADMERAIAERGQTQVPEDQDSTVVANAAAAASREADMERVIAERVQTQAAGQNHAAALREQEAAARVEAAAIRDQDSVARAPAGEMVSVTVLSLERVRRPTWSKQDYLWARSCSWTVSARTEADGYEILRTRTVNQINDTLTIWNELFVVPSSRAIFSVSVSEDHTFLVEGLLDLSEADGIHVIPVMNMLDQLMGTGHLKVRIDRSVTIATTTTAVPLSRSSPQVSVVSFAATTTTAVPFSRSSQEGGVVSYATTTTTTILLRRSSPESHATSYALIFIILLLLVLFVCCGFRAWLRSKTDSGSESDDLYSNGLEEADSPADAPLMPPAGTSSATDVDPVGPPLARVGRRVHDIAFEDGADGSALTPLFPRGAAVPPLRDALLRIAEARPGEFSAFHPDTGDFVRMAGSKAAQARSMYPHLTLDESTAIVLYTMEEDRREGSLYFGMNLALRSLDRDRVRPFVGYIWILLHALQKLPASDIRVVFRGCQKTPHEMRLNLSPGATFNWSAFSSTAGLASIMDTFLGDSGSRTMVHFELTQGTARDVRDFSFSPREAELVIPPNARGRVLSSYDAGNGLTIVQCIELESEHSLL